MGSITRENLFCTWAFIVTLDSFFFSTVLWTFHGIMGCTLMTCLMNKSLIICEMQKNLKNFNFNECKLLLFNLIFNLCLLFRGWQIILQGIILNLLTKNVEWKLHNKKEIIIKLSFCCFVHKFIFNLDK
jgi:hypothetical protein